MVENSDDGLEEIAKNDLSAVLSIIAKELPRAVLIYEFVKTATTRQKNNAEYDFTLYWHKEKINGILIGILRTGFKSFGLLLYASDGYEDLFEEILLRTRKINWEESPIIEPILHRHYNVVRKVLSHKNYSCESYFQETIQYLSPDVASTFQITYPLEIYAARLNVSRVDEIYEYWSSKSFRTKDTIRWAVEQNISYGLFSKESNELLAWAIQNHTGAISLLYTKEKARRRGYAKILIQLMAKDLSNSTIRPFAVVRITNEKSKSLFSALGFVCVANMRLAFVDSRP